MNAIREKLKGYKTYLVCAAAILTAVIAYANGAIGITEMVGAIFAAVYGIANRAGTKKAEV